MRRGTEATVPMVPGFVSVMVAPAKSSGRSLLPRAFSTSDSYVAWKVAKSIPSACLMTGTTRARLPSFFSTSTARPRPMAPGSTRCGLPSMSWKWCVMAGKGVVAAMSRKEVAVGTVRDSVMFATSRAAGPVIGTAPGGAGSTERGAGGAAGAGAGVAAACSVLRAPWMIGSSASFPLSNSSRHSGATDEGSRRYSSYMTCTKAALWVPKTNSLTRWNLQGILCARMALLALALILLQTQSPHTSLRAQVVARILQTTARGVGVYYRDLTTGDSLTVGSDGRFHAASTMKIPVMIQLFRDRDAGLLSLDDSIIVTNTFRSLVDSSPYQLDVTDDSDSSLYKRLGQHATSACCSLPSRTEPPRRRDRAETCWPFSDGNTSTKEYRQDCPPGRASTTRRVGSVRWSTTMPHSCSPQVADAATSWSY